MTPATDAHDFPEEEQFDHGSSAERRIGAVVAGSYRLTRHIGSGGSSHVFEAEHLRLGKTFAIKLLRPELDPNRRTAQRFRREARAIARLKSEHIVSVIDCGELDDGTPYLVMELLEGKDLRSLLNREGSLPARRAVPLIIEACCGLSEVHAAGLVHRDLKPENLFVTKRSTGEDWCKVLDFGVAKMDASLSTAQGAIVGTLRYMAPEQLEASATVGPATDVYALGAILYECLSGEPAHPGDTAQEVMYSVMNRATPEAPLHAAKVPASVVEAVMRCLAKQAEKRPRDTGRLKTLLSGQVASVASNTTFPTESDDELRVQNGRPSLQRPSRSGPLWVAGAAALMTGALLTLIGTSERAREEPLPAMANEAGLKGLQAASSSFSSQATPVAFPSEQPAAVPSPEALTPRASQGAASALGRRQHTPKPDRSQDAARLTTQSPRVAVGRFDPANPYGE
jgi:serine/threonine protein kinase